MALLLSGALAVIIGIYYKVKWKRIIEGISESIKSIIPAMIMLLLIGSLSGTWLISGIIPTMIYYGLKILNPDIFLFATAIITAIISVSTGSSWSTIATVGLALLSIGTAIGLPVGGAGPCVSAMAHTQGWLHCDIPATDASGVVKALMDSLIDDFKSWRMPSKVRLSTSCCAINCGGQVDIAIVVKHTRPPRINHEILGNICEMPKVVARCPVAAIRPEVVNNKPSLMVDNDKCMYCGACFGACPAMEINHPEHSKFAIWVGGKNSNARSKPSVMSLVAHNLPNNPPRWPEVTEVVGQILEAFRKEGRPWERMGEWIGRVGWKHFFEATGLVFDKDMIDSYRHARTTFNQSAHIRF